MTCCLEPSPKSLADAADWFAQRGQEAPPTLAKESNYFATQREHPSYAARAAEGGPMGSGAMESLCGQLPDRFKRGGQFWTEPRHRA